MNLSFKIPTKFTRVALGLFLATMPIACDKNSDEPNPFEKGREIGFNIEVLEDNQDFKPILKSFPYNELNIHWCNGTIFDVWAYYTPNTGSESSRKLYMSGIKMTEAQNPEGPSGLHRGVPIEKAQTGKTPWDYKDKSQVHFWPKDKELEFFAIMPSLDAQNELKKSFGDKIDFFGESDVLRLTPGNDYPRNFTLRVPNVWDQFDVTTAYLKQNEGENGTVTMPFKHLTSQILAEISSSNKDIKIEAIATATIFNVKGKADFKYNSSTQDWDLEKLDNKLCNYIFAIKPKGMDAEGKQNPEDKGKFVNADWNNLFLLPQDLSPVEVKYNEDIDGGKWKFLSTIGSNTSYIALDCTVLTYKDLKVGYEGESSRIEVERDGKKIIMNFDPKAPENEKATIVVCLPFSTKACTEGKWKAGVTYAYNIDIANGFNSYGMPIIEALEEVNNLVKEQNKK